MVGTRPGRRAGTTVLCDLGGVVVRYSFELALQRWAQLARRAPADLMAGLRIDEEFFDFETDEIDVASYLDHLRNQLGVVLSDQDLTDGWNSIYEGANEEAVDVLANARRAGVRVVAVTNTNVLHEPVWRERYADELRRAYDAVYVSNALRSRKPSYEFFAKVCAAEAVAMTDCLLVDDLHWVIDAVDGFGLRTHLYRDAAGLREAIEWESQRCRA